MRQEIKKNLKTNLTKIGVDTKSVFGKIYLKTLNVQKIKQRKKHLMNVLRELRKFKTKSAMAKIRVLILLAVMLIVSSYAWMTLRKDVEVGNLHGVVESWEVEYSINGEKVEEEVTIAIDEFYPGAYVDEDGDGSDWFSKTIAIKNMANEPTNLRYEVTSVKLFGNEVYVKDGINNEISVDYLNADKKIKSKEKIKEKVNI